MREIKFRAWDKQDEKMVNWDVLKIEKDKNGLFMWKPIDPEGRSHDGTEEFILMQYTGLKDKNGREIYEGDIFQLKSLYIDLETGNQHIETECIPVIFERGAFFLYERGIKHHSLYDILRGFGQGESSNEWGTEVVGNIYEDKHLLEVQT